MRANREGPDEVRLRVADMAGDQTLVTRRLQAATAAAACLKSAGDVLHVDGRILGDGRVAGDSPRGNGDDAVVGMAVLLQIAAELLEVSGSLLCGEHHYAGAALLRQVVEVEYLTWAFAQGERDAAEWLNSTRQERMSLFSPASLRRASNGTFLAGDYQHHCEQGGHPVPRAIPLLDSADAAVSQMLMLDLLLHSWRITDNSRTWAREQSLDPRLTDGLIAAQRAFAAWGAGDPLYQWSLAASQAPPPDN